MNLSGKGMSLGKFSADRNPSQLSERKFRKDGYTKILNGAYIEVYSQRDIDNMKRNLHNFGGG